MTTSGDRPDERREGFPLCPSSALPDPSIHMRMSTGTLVANLRVYVYTRKLQKYGRNSLHCTDNHAGSANGEQPRAMMQLQPRSQHIGINSYTSVLALALPLVLACSGNTQTTANTSDTALISLTASETENPTSTGTTSEGAGTGTRPGKGRVAVSPSGHLWFAPVQYLNDLPLASWPLPDSF